MSDDLTPDVIPEVIPEVSKDELVRRELLSILLRLNFHAYEQCIRQLLVKLGYRDARVLSRKSLRGRSHHGGRDLEAVAEAGLSRSVVLVQIKQYRRPVSRRFVDELRGAVLRTGAREGLLITTGAFSKAAIRAAAQAGTAPVTLLPGERLLDLLVQHRLGVKSDADGGAVLDLAYFTSLLNDFPQRTRACTEALPVRQWAKYTPNDLVPLNSNECDVTWRTHALFALSSLWLLDLFSPGIPGAEFGLLAIAAVLGGLLPDMDAQQSKLSAASIAGVRPLAPVAVLIHGVWGHRGPLHSLLGIGVVTVLVAPLSFVVDWRVPAAIVLGYSSHLVMDSCTKTGIPVLYPRRKRYFLLPRPLRFVTGSMPEDILMLLLAVLFLSLVLSHLPHWITPVEAPSTQFAFSKAMHRR